MVILVCLTGYAYASNAPVIFFTDIVSGPKTGGEGGNGAYVTIYGQNFGATPTVTVGGGQVSIKTAPIPWMWYQKFTIQLGAAATTGNIVVTAGGVPSNGLAFTVRSGNIYFVSSTGSDAANGASATPWKTMYHARSSMAAGDIIYVHGNVTQSTDDGQGWSSCMAMLAADSGTAGNPKAFVGYPGEMPTLGNILGSSNGGCDSGLRTPGAVFGVIAGFMLRGGSSEAVDIAYTNDWRIVGNDMTCPNGNGQAACLDVGPITNVWIYGNDDHDVGTNNNPGSVTALYHGVYFTDGVINADFGWNHVHHVYGCRGIQQNTSTTTDASGLSIHDNIINDTQCDGIVMTSVDPSVNGGINIYNNIIYDVGKGPANLENSGAWHCIDIQGYNNSGATSGTIEVYNNTMYGCGTWLTPSFNESSGGIAMQGPNDGKVIHARNNITQFTSGPGDWEYIKMDLGGVKVESGNRINGSNNLWYNNGASPNPSFLTASLNANPAFVNPSTASANPISDFALQSGSPAKDSGTAISGLNYDIAGNPRISGSAIDMGALEVSGSAPPPVVTRTACVTDASNPGCVHFMMRTASNFDVYTSNPPQAAKDWINSHFWRMQTSYGYFDPSGLTWDPNAWAYVNSSSALTSEAVSSQHPEWILKSGPEPNGAKLYNGFVNGNGQSSRYAMDIGDPGYRSWWISFAQGVVARGYKGLWIDDVNFDGIHTSDINGNYIAPYDDRTGATMTYTNWKQYFADFVTQIRAAMPNVEILHNSLYYSGNSPDGSDAYVQQEIKAANWINRERGVSSGIDGTGGPTDKYSLISYLNYADTVHSLGAYVDIQEFNFNGDYAVACYFLVSSGKDTLGNDAIGVDSSGNAAPGSNGAPTNWPANYDVQMGTPLGARYTWNGMYRRDFSNGIVIVNPPGGTQANHSLGATYKDVSGNTVTSVNLAAKTGIVLLATSVPALSVSTSTLPNGAVGTSYSQTLAATGGTPPYTWSVASGTLPAGLSLSAGGVLSGTPTTAGTYNFTVRVTDSVAATATHAFTVLINPASVSLSVTTSSLRGGTIGVAYSQSLSATGGATPYAWDISAGSLPPGLNLSASGVIAGTPTTAGTYNFTARVTDSVPNTATQALSIVISSGTSSSIQKIQETSIAGSSITTISQAFASNVTAHNTILVGVRASTPAPTITITDTLGNQFLLAVNQGQTTDSHSVWIYYAANVIGGADTVTASFAASNAHPFLSIFEVSGLDLLCPLDQTAAGTSGATASTAASTSPLTTTSANELLFAIVGESSTAGPAVTAGTGFVLDQVNTGTSRAATETQIVSSIGTYAGTATLATAANWSMAMASFKAASTTPVSITTNSLPATEISVDYSQTLSASAGTPPYVWSVASGALPSGITLSSSGIVAGAASTSGTYNFTAKVTDATSGTDTQALSIVIAGAPGVVTAGLPDGSVGTAYSQSIVSSGGIPPYTYALRTGSLPPGVSLSSSGTVSGTPTVAGTYDFTVQMTDSANVSAPTAGEEIIIGTAPQTQIQQVQSNAAEAFSVTSLSVAFSSANTSGNTIIICTRSSTITPGLTISDTLGNTYTLAVEETHNVNGAWDTAIYYAKGIKAGVNTVTATFATTNYHPWLAIYEYGGLDPANPLDQAMVAESGSTQSTAAATPSVTTNAANELLFAGMGLNTSSAVTVSAGSGYTAQLQDTAASRGFTETQIVNALGSYNASAALNTADYWTMALATFKAAANVTPLVIVTTSLPNGAVTAPYTQALQVNGGTPAYSWSVISGALPPGLTLQNGIISGTPTTAGSYPFNVAATDSGSPPATATQGETITVLPAAVTGAYNSAIGGKGSLGGSAVIH